MTTRKSRDTAPTKKQIALSKRERQNQRRVYIGLGVLIVLVLGVLGVGAYRELVLKPATPIATVNGKPITLNDYQKRVRYTRWQLDTQVANISSALSNSEIAENEYLVQYYQQKLQQLEAMRSQIGYTLVDQMIQEELIRQKAAAEKLSVSDQEITDELNRVVAQNVGALTAADATATIVAGPEATATALSFTPTPLPTPTPTLTATAVITASPTPISPTATPDPTSTPYILGSDKLGEQRQQFLQALSQGAGWSEADYRKNIEVSLLYEKLNKLFADNAPNTAEQVHASQILLDDEEQAKKALSRLQQGEDFAAVAKEVSTDEGTKDKGGDLGWFPRETYQVPLQVAEAAFALQPGEVVTEPVQSYVGYHLVRALEREASRPLSETDLQIQKQQALSNWLQEQLADEKVVVKSWTLGMVPTETASGY